MGFKTGQRVFRGSTGLLIAVLAAAGFLGAPASRAAPPVGYSASKIDFYFETFLEVEVRGKVMKSEEPGLLDMNTTFTQSLLYAGRSSREVNRTFASLQELRRWVETELCTETQEIELKPIKHSGVRGEQKFRARLKPLMIGVGGKDTGTPAKVFREDNVCKRPPINAGSPQ